MGTFSGWFSIRIFQNLQDKDVPVHMHRLKRRRHRWKVAGTAFGDPNYVQSQWLRTGTSHMPLTEPYQYCTPRMRNTIICHIHHAKTFLGWRVGWSSIIPISQKPSNRRWFSLSSRGLRWFCRIWHHRSGRFVFHMLDEVFLAMGSPCVDFVSRCKSKIICLQMCPTGYMILNLAI